MRWKKYEQITLTLFEIHKNKKIYIFEIHKNKKYIYIKIAYFNKNTNKYI